MGYRISECFFAEVRSSYVFGEIVELGDTVLGHEEGGSRVILGGIQAHDAGP
jgi:hypothetical protein